MIGQPFGPGGRAGLRLADKIRQTRKTPAVSNVPSRRDSVGMGLKRCIIIRDSVLKHIRVLQVIIASSLLRFMELSASFSHDPMTMDRDNGE